jgi:rod shape-determining protein MreC
MESFFGRYKNLLVLATVLLMQVIGLAMQVRRVMPQQPGSDGGTVRLARYWAVSAVSPFERILLAIGHGTRHAWSNYIDLRGARRDSESLRAEVSRLRLEQAGMAEDVRQAQRLQALLGFRERYIYKTVAAQVIGTSGTDQSRMLYIDKGSHDGLRPDMPVITPDGIVGKVKDVFPSVSQVLEVSDQTAGAGAVLETTRLRGILRGNAAGQLQIINLLPDDRIKPGERVLTSGGDQVFPRGLPVGVVTGVERDRERDPYINVMIKPAANLSRLEEVLVITQLSDHMTATQQKDLNEAQSLGLAGRRASDVLSEELPSTQRPGDPTAPDLIHPPDKDTNPNSVPVTVKPPPALHPDRFSPPATKAPAAQPETKPHP